MKERKQDALRVSISRQDPKRENRGGSNETPMSVWSMRARDHGPSARSILEQVQLSVTSIFQAAPQTHLSTDRACLLLWQLRHHSNFSLLIVAKTSLGYQCVRHKASGSIKERSKKPK